MTDFIKTNKDKIALYLAIIVSLIIFIRWWYYIYAYSVNMMFWDHWDLYEAFIKNSNWWELFRWQHGAQRQGIGFIITKYAADLSGWNTRVEAFVIGGVICLAAAAALLLRKKFCQRMSFSDVAIPLIFLTPLQYQIYAGAPDLSPTAMPLLLLMLYLFAWTAMSGIWKYFTVLILNFLLTYTGYSLLAGIITPFVFGVEFIRAFRARNNKDMRIALVCTAIAVLTFLSFFIGFSVERGVLEEYRFPISQWWLYPLFMSLMLANFCGIEGVTLISIATGLFILIGMIALAVYQWLVYLKEKGDSPDSRMSMVIAFPVTFTIIYCAAVAAGRISLGLESAQSSRYVTLMIPGFFAIYLWLVRLPEGSARKVLLTAAVVCMIAATFPLRESDREYLRISLEGKNRWKNYYLLTEDSELTTRETHFIICYYPEKSHLQEKLDYLKKNKLNLYLDQK